jgi:hypothetical protein
MAKPSLWRHRSKVIVQRVLDDNKIAIYHEASSEAMCDACQCAKSHQLAFPKSSSVSKAPLELVFSNVWRLGPSLVGKNKYYVSFLDLYSKFTWIFLFKNKSEVFVKFHIFQQHIERLFNRKIVGEESIKN